MRRSPRRRWLAGLEEAWGRLGGGGLCERRVKPAKSCHGPLLPGAGLGWLSFFLMYCTLQVVALLPSVLFVSLWYCAPLGCAIEGMLCSVAALPSSPYLSKAMSRLYTF